MNSYNCYYKDQGKLHCFKVGDVEDSDAEIISVKEWLEMNKVPHKVLRRVLAVVK